MEADIILTEQQNSALRFATHGHNLCILGEAGTGKSLVVKLIKQHFRQKGLNCQIVCSSGIACDVYDIGEAATVHSHYGLQKAEVPFPRIVQRSLSRNDVVSRIRETAVLIWDEISMSSQRILEIVNLIHHEIFDNREPFGGIQVILVGDFFQLKPVPSAVDPGNLMFTSVVFDTAFPHRIELTMVMRQEIEQRDLKAALQDLRHGNCSEVTEQYFQLLNRNILSVDQAIHIFFKRLPVDIHNFNKLVTLPGELIRLESSCTGNTTLLETTIPKTIHLKEGCKVMLLYNLNQSLRNGSRGTFVRMANDFEMIVTFPKTGEVRIPKKTWYAHDKEGRSIGSRTQFPIVPCYAMTAHKAQGLTLKSVVVHCSPEFVSGQTYVSISRVRRAEDIQIIGFKKKFILPLSQDIVHFKPSLVGAQDTTGLCCVHKPINDELFFEVHEASSRTEATAANEAIDYESCQEDYEKLILSYFESNEGTVLDLEDVFYSLIDFERELGAPPQSFDALSFIKEFVNTAFDDGFTKSINDAAQYAIDHIEEFKLLISIFWSKLFELFKDYLVENPDQIHICNKDFTSAIGKVHSMFLTNEYRSYVLTFFGVERWSDVVVGQQALCAQMLLKLYQLLVSEIACTINQAEQNNPVIVDVSEMNDDGKGKVRHVGGWGIRKVLECSRRYVRENKFSQNSTVRARLMREARKVQLLDEFVIAPFEVLESSSQNPATLAVTESRQYRERGLLHISDDAYEFFIILEQERVNEINEGKLKQLTDGMVENALSRVKVNAELLGKFTALFDLDEEIDEALVGEIYKDLVTRYFRMGAGQFLRDYRRSSKTKKAVAHRKLVLQRKEKTATRNMKVHLPQIQLDQSPHKQTSHGRLVALLAHSKERGVQKIYTKAELQKLCRGYEVEFRSSWNKQKLTELLAAAIRSNVHIPAFQLLCDFTSDVLTNGNQQQPLRIRIRRV